MTRIEKAAEAIRLLNQGLTYKEIGERLGISHKTAWDLVDDPRGSKARARKAKNNGICIDCGGETRNGGAADAPERCLSCRQEYQRTLEFRRQHMHRVGCKRRWTDDQIFAAIRGVADADGLVTITGYLAAYEAAPRGSMPSMPLIVRRFEFWDAAATAAGCHTKNGSKGPYATRLTREGVALAIQECRAEIGNWPTYAEYTEWARRVGAPSGETIRLRMGGKWMAAVELAIASETPEAAAA